MTTLQEAARKALEALRKAMQGNLDFDVALEAFEALRTALAQQGEPIFWWDGDKSSVQDSFDFKQSATYKIPLYAAAPAPQAQPAQYDKTEMNAFVQNLYDEKMREGKHGHYETLFHVVHKAIALQSAQPVAPYDPIGAWNKGFEEGKRLAQPVAQPVAQPAQEEFCEGQWWLEELDAMVADGTPDQKRAVYGVVRNLMRQFNEMHSAQPAASLQEIVGKWQTTPGTLVHPDLAKAVAQPLRELSDEEIIDAIRPLYGTDESAEMAAKVSMDEFRAVLKKARGND